ncbi:hypothetical protein NYA8BAC_01011 [Psychrobacter okhotskensis]|mgnify:CR=1 FL=1|nr:MULTISPECIES: hypothetical protein [Psychrobacter]
MAGSSGGQNQDEKVYEIVNKYYYDIESITVYFKRYCIFSKRFEHKGIAWLMLFLMLSISYHAIMVIVMESSILQSVFPIYIYKSKILGWIFYLASLAVYVAVLLFINSRKTDILESKYGSKDIQIIQDKWLKNNLPENMNSFSLVSKSTEWFQSYHKVNHNEFLSTGKLLQNSKINIIMKNFLAVIGLSISAKFLGGVEVSEIASKYPNETVLIAFNLFILILLCLFLYSLFQIFARRFISAIDGRNSKSSYRFNIFNRMLLHHVTLKDFKD